MTTLSWTVNRAIRTYDSQNHRSELRIYGQNATYTFSRLHGSMACDVQHGVMVYIDHQHQNTRLVWAQRGRWAESGDAVSFRCDGLWVDVTVPGTSEAAVMQALSTARARAPMVHPIPARIDLQEVVEV